MASKLAQKELGRSVHKGLAGDYDGSSLVKTRVDQARVLAENLSQLKGAAMKAGQLLSIDSSDFLPPEVIEILSKLQDSAEPIAFEKLRSVVTEDIAPEVFSQVENLEEKAFAAASIGQVHRARYKGQEIVLKIQYPGVADSIDSDLRILKKVAQGFLTVSGKSMALDALFEEMKVVLRNEANYEYERECMQKFSELVKGHPEYVVPTPIPELSSKRVLAMTYIEGESFSKWVNSKPSREQRDFVGRKILDLYCHEFFDWGAVQTDPNYANFKIQSNPTRIVLLDFGATKFYDSSFVDSYRTLLKTFATFDRSAILEASLSFGLIDERESDETKANFADFLKSSVEPFFPHLQPFRFRDEDFAKRAQEIGKEFTSNLKYSAPPEQIIFLHRKLGGIFNMLRKLDCELNLSPYWLKMVGEEFRLEPDQARQI
jgi:aarF domain-containing kinase